MQDYTLDPWVRKKFYIDYILISDAKFFAGRLWFHDRIIIPVSRLNEIISAYHSQAASFHWGMLITYDIIARKFHHPKLRRYIRKFIMSCDVCQRTKSAPSHSQSICLSFPPRKWHSISLDWIEGLPLTHSNHDSILTVTDRATKMVHLIATSKSSTSLQTANLFISNGVSLVFTVCPAVFILTVTAALCPISGFPFVKPWTM